MSDTLFESYDTGDDTSKGAIFGTAWRGQTFTPATAHTITSAKVKLSTNGSPGTMDFGIYATSGGKPTGSALDTATFNGNTLTATAVFVEVFFTGAVMLSAGTQYALVFSAPSGSSANAVTLRSKNVGTYAGGSYIFSSNGGSSWSADTGDIMFDEYGLPAVKQGSASGGFAFAGSATGNAQHKGAAAGTVSWAGAAVGGAVHAGTAAGTLTWAGAATGRSVHQGAASGGYRFTGIATGTHRTKRDIDVTVTSGTGRWASAANPADRFAASTGPPRWTITGGGQA